MSAQINDRRRAYALSIMDPAIRDLIARLFERIPVFGDDYEAVTLPDSRR